MKKMIFGKKKVYILSVLFFLTPLYANAFDPFENSGLPSDAANDYINSLGYNTNEPQKLPDGSYAIFLTGMAEILADPQNPNFIESRSNAFDRAVLNAKSEFAKFLERKINGEIKLSITSGNFPSTEDTSSALENTVIGYLDRANMLIMSELDKRLLENGVDINSIQEKSTNRKNELEEAAALAEKTLSTTEFSRAIELTANRFVSGVQILGVFEDFTPGETKGTIAVAAVYSDKTLKIAQAILRNDPSLAPEPNVLNPGLSIKETVKDFGKGLLTFQGAKLIINERGEPVILSFAQTGLPKNSTTAKLNATKKANLIADSYIDQFVGEIVSAFEAIEGKESFKDLTDGEHYNYEEGYKQNITSKFGGNNISGVKKVVEWIQPHPLTDQTIIGVVRSWSPTSAYLAGKAKKGQLSKEPEPKSVNESSSDVSEIKEEYSSSGVSSNTDF
jgi:hypothetical protein